MSQVVTVTLAEATAAEDALNEAITDEAFLPSAPLTAPPALYNEAATYGKGALVTAESGIIYRSQAAGNKGNNPAEDADFVHWAPAPDAIIQLQKADYNRTPTTMTQQAHNNKPPASSAATAAPLETIGVGAETPV